MIRAICAAVDFVARFDAVADDAAIAMGALRRERVDGALKAVERVRFSRHSHVEGFVVFVSADFTFWHGMISPIWNFLRAMPVSNARGIHAQRVSRSCAVSVVSR